jgi:hypothetical protein
VLSNGSTAPSLQIKLTTLCSPILTGVLRIPPALVLAYGASYAVSTYQEMSRASAAAESQAEMRRRQMLLDDAYGDRTSLEGLERAMRLYETQSKER